MQGLNKVILIGTLANEPRHSHHKESSKLWMRLRVTDEYTDRDGVARERTSYHTVVLWGARADALRPFLPAGRRVAIEGRLHTFRKRDVEPARYETEIVAREVILLGAMPEAARNAA